MILLPVFYTLTLVRCLAINAKCFIQIIHKLDLIFSRLLSLLQNQRRQRLRLMLIQPQDQQHHFLALDLLFAYKRSLIFALAEKVLRFCLYVLRLSSFTAASNSLIASSIVAFSLALFCHLQALSLLFEYLKLMTQLCFYQLAL